MPKATTREVLQAQTREAILVAARQVFLDKGFHATTIAQIAKAADRTHGALYGHFPSKEALCLEVLRLHYEQVLGQVGAALVAADGIPGKLLVIEDKWRMLTEETDWATLTAGYVLATRQDPAQAAAVNETANGLQGGVRMLLQIETEAQHITVNPEFLDRTVVSLVSLGMGLIAAQGLGTIDSAASAATLLDNLRMWLMHIGFPPIALDMA